MKIPPKITEHQDSVPPESQNLKAPIRRISGKAKHDPEDFLRSFLSTGPKSTHKIFLEAQSLGISQTSLYNVRSRLGIISYIQGARQSRSAYWELPGHQGSRTPQPQSSKASRPQSPKTPAKMPQSVPRKVPPKIKQKTEQSKPRSVISEEPRSVLSIFERQQMEEAGIDTSNYD